MNADTSNDAPMGAAHVAICLKDEDENLIVECHSVNGLPEHSPSRIVAHFIASNWGGICSLALKSYKQSLGTIDVEPEVVAPTGLKLISSNGGFVSNE